MREQRNDTALLWWMPDELLHMAQAESVYNSRSLLTEQGEPLYDRYVLTVDERPFFERHLPEALAAVRKHFRRIEPAQPPLLPATAVGLAFRIRCNAHDRYELPEASFADIETLTASLLCNHILREWYVALRLAEVASYYTQRRSEQKAQLARLLFNVYRPTTQPAATVVPYLAETIPDHIILDGGKPDGKP